MDGLGARIRQQRLAKGFGQAELAGRELSASYISLIESGKRVPSAAVLELLAGRLGRSVGFLRDGVEEHDVVEFALELRYAELALRSGEAAEAADRFRRLADRAADFPDPELRLSVMGGLARSMEAVGRLEQAIALYEDVREQAQASLSAQWLPTVIGLCRCYKEVGDLGHAVDLAEQALQRANQLGLGGTELEIELTSTLVGAFYERGDLVRARNLVEKLIERAERLDSRRARGAAYWNASLVAQAQGRSGEALSLAERALAMLAEGEDARSLARLRVAYAWLLLHAPQPRTGPIRRLLESAAADLHESGSEVDLAYCDTELARLHLAEGQADKALQCARRALGRLARGPRQETARALLVLGQALWAAGRREEAQAAYRQAADGLEAMEANRQAADTWSELAEVLAATGDLPAALSAQRQALRCAGVPGRPAMAAVPVGAAV